MTPSDAEYDRSSTNHWQMPQPTWTEPHGWLHLEWGVPKAYAGAEISVPKAWAVTGEIGEIGGFDTPGGTWVYEVVKG